MAKARGVDAKLARLRTVRAAPGSTESINELRLALADPSNLVVAEAAQIAGANDVRAVTADLAAAFERLMVDPEESDKQCRGKNAIVEALYKHDYADPAIYQHGITHVQDSRYAPLDPGQDAAGPMRACCALGLARLNVPERLNLLTDLLLDRDHAARAGAARALGASGSLAAIPLLRYKVQLGDKKPEIMGECFEALLTLAFAESLPFVARFLHDGGEVAEAAIFALAESRKPAALTTLMEFWPNAPANLQETVLLGIAMFRLPAGLDFLIGLLAQKHRQSRAAVSALAIHRHDAKVKERVAVAVATNGNAEVWQWFEKKFPQEGAGS